MFAKPMDLAMLEAPAPIFQHERRHLMSCSDAVFSMNGCQISCSCIKLMLHTSQKKDSKKNEKRFPQRNEHQTNDAVDGDGIPHTEFKAIWPFRHDMLSSEAYVDGGKNPPPPRML